MLSQVIFQMKRSNTRFATFAIRFIFFLFLLQSGLRSNAQYQEPLTISRSTAYEMLERENYKESIRQFSSLLNEDPDNANYKLALAKAYNYSSIDHKKGLEILEELAKDLKRPLGTFFELGVAYHKNYMFNKALGVFEELKFASQAEEDILFLQSWIDRSSRAKVMYAHPVGVRLVNLGEEVNSAGPDFLPFVEPDESEVYFTTKREGVVGNLFDYSGYRTADIYSARNRSDEYSRARSIGHPNTNGNEYTAGRSENGDFLVYHINSEEYYSDLFISEKGKRSYLPPVAIQSEDVNQKTSSEIGAAVSNDGRRIYFCSDRAGGMGGFDIWIIRKLPIGEWAEPQNLGPPINTEGDEKYPFLRGDEDLIYFSSDGHPGMGGMDLFIAERNKENDQWSQPRNMGYPINTPDDDLSISYASHSKYAYIGTMREDSYGDLDIYRLIFNDVSPEYTLLSGRVMNTDSSMIEAMVLIEIFEGDSKKLYGAYIMNRNTGRYNAILPPGDYRIEIHDAYGYQNFKQRIRLYSKNEFIPSKTIDIILKKDSEEQEPDLDTRIKLKEIK